MICDQKKKINELKKKRGPQNDTKTFFDQEFSFCFF